jgi:hypothetical protein
LPASGVCRRGGVPGLFQACTESAVAAGTSPEGVGQAFAARVEISPSMWRQIKSSRPIRSRSRCSHGAARTSTGARR